MEAKHRLLSFKPLFFLLKDDRATIFGMLPSFAYRALNDSLWIEPALVATFLAVAVLPAVLTVMILFLLFSKS